MKRMEVPRLPLHNLQGGTGIAPAEIVKPHKPADVTQPPMPVASMPENQSEPSPPPSRILRSGKRVPIGTASKAPPRTASKASRAAVPEANEDLQAAGTPAATAYPAAKQTHASPVSSSHGAGIKSLDAARSPETFQAPPTGMLPVAPPAATGNSSLLHAGATPPPTQMQTSPVLLGIQTSVSPVLTTEPQPSPSSTTPASGLGASEVTSPVALAPAVQNEAPTPILMPKASMARPAFSPSVGGTPAETSPPVASAASSPRDILSSLQQMNLQSRPLDFAHDAQQELSPPALQPALEHSGISEGSHSSSAQDMREQTPELGRNSTPQQAVAGETPEVSPGEQDRYPLQTEDSTALQQTTDPEDEQEEEEAEAVPAGYVSRRTTDPYMQKKLRGLQKEEWSAADGTFKVHKSKLELAKEQAAAARSEQLGSADKAAVRRLVATAFQRVIATGGQSLGESMVKHKSRLEREKEVAEQQRKAEEAAQAQRAKRKVVHTPGPWAKQGLGELGKHKSRLEKEKDAAAAARRAAGSSPPVSGKLPSYMRPTSASKAMQKGLGEDVTKPKSRLEREKEAAAAGTAAGKAASSSELRKSASKVRSKVAEAWQGQGLESVMHKRISKLEQDKENAAAAAASTSPKDLHKAVPAVRKSMGWGGQGLGEMKVHKSKLQKDKDAWAKAAAAEEGPGKAGSAASRKPLLKESNSTNQKTVLSGQKKVPSYMKSTHTSNTRNSLGSASDTDARFAF